MSNYTHETVPTQFVEAEGTRYAYRRFGKAGTVPLPVRLHRFINRTEEGSESGRRTAVADIWNVASGGEQ
jgi:hypothetical protein